MDSSDATKTFFDLTAKNIDGQVVNLSGYRGKKAILVVNVASKCGLTNDNYKQLVSIYSEYSSQGLEILGFPCNQFKGQEPGTDAEIKACVLKDFSVNFPLFSKVDVNGEHTDQVYNWLKSHSSLKGADGVVADIAWNFGKFVVDGEGNVVEYFGPKQQPQEIVPLITKLLGVN